MRPLATSEQTVVILLPEESSAERAEVTPSLDDRVCSLSPALSSTHAFEDAQTGLGSSLYSTNNSSSDTIPETHNDRNESAFPLITLIKPGDHNKDHLTGETKTAIPTVRLEDTVQDLELSTEFNIEYTHTPPSQRPQTAGESPSKRRLSGRTNSHRRVKSETSGISSPFSPERFTIQEVSETESNPQLANNETAVPIHEATLSQTSSSAYVSSVDSPSSFILPYSQPLPKYHDLCTAMDEKADNFEMPTTASSPLKRRARTESECEGLSYVKRTKHSHNRRPATALDTIIISSSPTNSDEEDATARLSNPLVAGLMSSPSYEIPPMEDIERQQELDDTAYRLKRHLSFSEALSAPHDLGSPSESGSYTEHLQDNAAVQAIPEESCQIRIEIEHKDCVDSKQHKRVISDTLEVREVSTHLDVRSSFEMHVKDELIIPPSIDPMDDKNEGQSYDVLPPVECHTSTKYTLTADSQEIELKTSETTSASNLSPLKLESTTKMAHRISKKRKGPILRVGLSKLAPVESLHSYLRKRKA